MGMKEKMIEECSPGMTADEKKKMMGEMMPKVIMAMMGGGEGEAGMEGMMAQMKSACGGEGGMSCPEMGVMSGQAADPKRQGEMMVLKGEMMKKMAEMMAIQGDSMIKKGRKQAREAGK